MKINTEKIKACHEEILDLINKKKMSEAELLLLHANLGYSLGASINGYEGVGPSMEILEKKYYSGEAGIGDSMMLQSGIAIAWYNKLIEGLDQRNKPLNTNISNQNEK